MRAVFYSVLSLPLLASLHAAPMSPVSLPTSVEAVSKDAADAKGRQKWAMQELQRTMGAAAWTEFLTNPNNATLLSHLQGQLLYELMFSGPVPKKTPKMLSIMRRLLAFDGGLVKSKHELTTAAAVALTYSLDEWPEEAAVARYKYYRDSRLKNQLQPMFNTFSSWEKRYVVSAGNSGGYDNVWKEESLEWLRDNVKLPVAQYMDACWQVPYRLLNEFGDSIHGSRFYMPYEGINDPRAVQVRNAGGVCGTLSNFGARAACANGIPAMTMGEPGHCAHAIRLAPGKWTPTYTMSSRRSPHNNLWSGGWTALILQDDAFLRKPEYDASCALTWQARALQKENPKLANEAYRKALAALPINLPVWEEYITWQRDTQSLDLAQWKLLRHQALTAMADYPDCAFPLARIIDTFIIKKIPRPEQPKFLATFHEVIAKHKGPEAWNIEGAMSEQAALLDPADKVAYFEQALQFQKASEYWLGPVIFWGGSELGKTGSNDWILALGRALQAGSATGAGEATNKALQDGLTPALFTAEREGNIEAFQAISKVMPKGTAAKPLKAEAPFPGINLSSGGLIQLSSSNGRYDSPGGHADVLGPAGGAFMTRESKNPFVLVKLKYTGELSGVILHDSIGGGARVVPLKISVSEDGKTWTEVWRVAEWKPSWRADLTGKSPRASWVKVERDGDGGDVFHLTAIQVFGRKLQ